jgi:hypothetical protein
MSNLVSRLRSPSFWQSRVVRQLEIDIWGFAAIAAFVLVVSASIVWIRYGLMVDPITAFAEDTTSVEVTRRILADTPWFGCGAGCFRILADICRLPSEPTRVQTAATAGPKIAIKLGSPVLWTILAAILLATAVFTSGCTQTRPRFVLSVPGSGLSHGELHPV